MINPFSAIGGILSGLPSFWPVVLALMVCGAIGFRRGWIRELASLGFILLAWLLVVLVGFSIVRFANRLVLMAEFASSGGFDSADPSALLRGLKATPLIDPSRPEWFYGVLFAIGVSTAYLMANRVGAIGKTLSESILGMLAGALNGYLISFVLLEYAQKAAHVGGRSTSGTSDWALLPGGYLTTIAIVVVVGAVAISLTSMLRGAHTPIKAKRAGRASG